MQHESWLPVPGYEGIYEVSDMGSVRSLDRIDPKNHPRKGAAMKASLVDGRYLRVTLTKNGKEKTKKVHQLVLEAFVGPRPAGMLGCHNDGDRLNCRRNNLRWDTPKANSDDCTKHGTRCRGEKQHCATLLETDIPGIVSRYIAGTASVASMAQEFGVSSNAIRKVLAGKSWAHVTRKAAA